jgi:formate hydrogenlyase subunit 3/multisubunit Na+/H+ antiporter MnhD subunit
VTPIPGPIILLALPLVAAGATYALRRWASLAALVAVGTTGALSFLCLRLPLDRSAFVLGQEVAFGRPVVIVGNTLALDPAGKAWLAFIFAFTTLFYLFAWRIAQGRSFFSFSLTILSLYALIALLQSFSLAILVYGMATTPIVFIVQAGQHGSVRGAQRYLLVMLLGVPLLLVAAWLVGQSPVNPDSAEMAGLALLPAAFGFGLLLAVFPFGTWMPALAADAPPIVTAFVFTVAQVMAIYLAVVFLRDAPWPLDDRDTLDMVQLAGLVMVASGGAMAAVQRDWRRVFGYAALSDAGYILLAFGIGGSQGLALTLLHASSRSLSITLMAAALAILHHRATTTAFAGLGGVARRLPVTLLGLILGGLALAGFPVTAGFPTHWAIGRAVSSGRWSWALVLIASSAAIAVGLLRGLSSMLGSAPRDEIARQPIIASLMVLALAGLAIILGLHPQLFLEPVRNAVEAFSLF